MHRYSDALEQGNLEEALKDNLYGTIDTTDQKAVKAMTERVKACIKSLKTQSFDSIINSETLFQAESQ